MFRFLLVVFLLTAEFEAKRFVLLDPDDSNLEKSAANITDTNVRARSLKMAKFRKWLKYDVDCDFISRDELEDKITQGRCPYESKKKLLSTTTTKQPKSLFFKRKRKPMPKIDKSLFSHQNKENMVRAVVGSSKMRDIDLTPLTSPDMELVSSSMVTLLCDEKNRADSRKKNEELEYIEWFVNGKRVKPSWFDWRVSVSLDGRLGIWPIGEDDSGHFECLANGQMRASVTIRVVPMSQVLLDGLLNYLFVCAIFAVATVSMGCLLGSRNQERKEAEVDRMEEFLAENVFKTDQMAKERVAGILEKQGVVDEREVIEKKANGNRSTIMLLLQNPEMKKNVGKKPATQANDLLTTEKEKDKTSAKEGEVVGTTTTTTEGAGASDGAGAGIPGTTTTTKETETIKKNEEEESSSSSSSEEEDEKAPGGIGTTTTSKGSTTKSKDSKSKDGKKKTKKKKKKDGKRKKTGKKGKKKGKKTGKKKGKGGGGKKASKPTAAKKPSKK